MRGKRRTSRLAGLRGESPLDRVAKPDPESPALAEQIEVCEHCETAWKHVRKNKGGGVDGASTPPAAGDKPGLDGTYQPQPVRVEQAGRSQKTRRPLCRRQTGQAVLQVLQAQWDPTFSEHSYGFRPGRSAHQAVAQAQAYIAERYRG